ncbi:MAG: DUF835 domain-containing protein [Thermoplasmata archaeon]|nr:MAG: DUF835 domain-containing protein [Thermoplasmata archaeon]
MLDIPEGTKIGKAMKGGENTLEMVMDLLRKKTFSGYVMVKLEKGGENITSYMIIKDSKPELGVREVIKKGKKDAKKLVRKVYAGENTINDVKEDSQEENASIEVHSGMDIDDIIDRYGKQKKERTEGEEERKDTRRIGLFWGGKAAEENMEREILSEKLNDWETEGYDVSELKKILSADLTEVKAAFEKFEEEISTLEEMKSELDFLSLAGFEKEVAGLKEKLKDPSQIPNIRAEIEALQKRKDEIKGEVEKKLCPVCGDLLNSDGKCPKCSTRIVKKEEKEEKPKGMEPQSGHCYIIEEEKLRRSLGLFKDTLNRGYIGFCITRTNPKHLKILRDLKDATIIWLTDKESTTGPTIPPILERIIYEIGDFLKKEEQACVILDGIEYLVSNNSFDAVLRFIRRIIDDVSDSKSILLVAVGPHTLKEQELKILEREMEKITFD